MMTLRLLMAALVACTLVSCESRESQWERFRVSLFTALKTNDANALLTISDHDVDDAKRYAREAENVIRDRGWKFTSPEIEITQERVDAARLGDIKRFLNLYDDVLKGEPVKFVTRECSLQFVSSIEYSAIVWFKLDGKYRGVVIAGIREVGSDMKVRRWSSWKHTGNTQDVTWVKAVLESDTPEGCNYPDSIKYDVPRTP
jgi:hypothetical protein